MNCGQSINDHELEAPDFRCTLAVPMSIADSQTCTLTVPDLEDYFSYFDEIVKESYSFVQHDVDRTLLCLCPFRDRTHQDDS